MQNIERRENPAILFRKLKALKGKLKEVHYCLDSKCKKEGGKGQSLDRFLVQDYERCYVLLRTLNFIVMEM